MLQEPSALCPSLSQYRQRQGCLLLLQDLSASGVEFGTGSWRPHTTCELSCCCACLALLWGRKLRGQRCSSGQQQAKTQLYAEKHSGRPFQQIGLKSHSSTGLNES